MNTESEHVLIDLVDRAPIGPADAGLEYYRRVLWHSPTALFVADDLGVITFMNEAMEMLTGWSASQVVGTSMVEYLHRDDQDWVTDTFVQLVGAPASDRFESRYHLTSVQLRIMGPDGLVVPVELTGNAGFGDHIVGGMIFTLRPTHGEDLVARVLNGIAAGDPAGDLLAHVLQLVTTPPLRMDAAVLEVQGSGFRVVATTSDDFGANLRIPAPLVPWTQAAAEPEFVAAADLPVPMAAAMTDLGYSDFWHIAVEPAASAISYRIVAAMPVHQVPAVGARNRVSRARELASAVLYRAHMDRMLEEAATHDGLTELHNRAGFSERLTTLQSSAAEKIALLFIDLDDFKQVNDDHGHAAGDAVLKEVALRLTNVTRPSDVVSRLGGDEFAILLSSSVDHPLNDERLKGFAERIQREIAEPVRLDDRGGREVSVRASIGVAVASSPCDMDELQTQADAAMYGAKRAGTGRPHFVNV